MTDQLKPEDRALIERVIGCNPGRKLSLHDVGLIIDAARTEGLRSGEALEAYDAGLLSDHGGGNVEWWQDYLRAELGRAHDFYQSQVSAPPVEAKPAEGVNEQAIAELIYKSVVHVFAEPVEPNPADYLPAARAILALIPARDEAALPEPVAWPHDKPPPHWTPIDRYDRHPKFERDWDWSQDGPAGEERRNRTIRRLNFAGDLADPRAPDQMALVLRKDLIDIKHWLITAEARVRLYRDREAQSVSDTDQLPVAWMKEWSDELGRPRSRVDRNPEVEPWLAALSPSITALVRQAHPATGTDELSAREEK